jgi:hypothetical protein
MGGAMTKQTLSFLAVLLMGSGCSSAPSNGEGWQEVRDELLAMAKEDQGYRDMERIMAMPSAEQQKFMKDGAEADRRHTNRLKEIVGARGWPTRQLVGEDGTNAAFLIAQHADHDPQFQEEMLPLLEAAAEKGEILRRDVAYLTDRVRVKQGRPQLYGTQYEALSDDRGGVIADADGKLTYLLPVVEDLENLDRRRAAVGLGLWIEYEKRMAKLQGREAALTPRSASQ